ncbi:hypothetical protein [Massilia timonae]|uniref:hypothetical protein n=1 Tax=Massilia timonae TaxID=47229 RepID=UPI00289B4089|nr:hypothetical protein [Massilia timonae]
MTNWSEDDDDDDGLPDAAFTELERAAGVQHIVRTGNPNAFSSGRRSNVWPSREETYDRLYNSGTRLGLAHASDNTPLHFDTFQQARAWAIQRPGRAFTRAASGTGFDEKVAQVPPASSRSVKPPASSPVSAKDHEDGERRKRMRELNDLSVHIYTMLTFASPGGAKTRRVPYEFDEGLFTWDLQLCNVQDLPRLRAILLIQIGEMQADLSGLLDPENYYQSEKKYYGSFHTAQHIKMMRQAVAVLDAYSAKKDGS